MDYLTDYVGKLDRAPVIMGHSFGGTVAQLLVGNGLGAAGVSIDGAATKGINVQPLSEVRSVLPVLDNPANINKASTLTPKQFHYAFTNTLDEEAAQAAYDRYQAPTPAKVLFQGGSPPSPRTRRRRSTTPTTTGPRCCCEIVWKWQRAHPRVQVATTMHTPFCRLPQPCTVPG
jgi:hypothetical protein